MVKDWIVRLVEATAVTITVAAVLQELEKPREERSWYGRLGFVPYDFRLPTLQRLKKRFWNTEDRRLLTPNFFGVGWSINFFALMEKLRIISEAYLSEDDFLMPTPTLRKVIEDHPALEEA